MLMDYFSVFGSKPCVMDDLCLFVEVFDQINHDSVLSFTQRVQQLIESEPVDFDCSEEDLKQNVRQKMYTRPFSVIIFGTRLLVFRPKNCFNHIISDLNFQSNSTVDSTKLKKRCPLNIRQAGLYLRGGGGGGICPPPPLCHPRPLPFLRFGLT